jgi:hypothetical protein
VRASVLSLAILLGSAALGSGAPAAEITYKASGSAAPVKRSVALKVVDNRPPNEGGKEGHVVGYRRSAVGLKARIKVDGPGVVPDLVRAVTVDALGRAGVGVSAEAPVVLTAQLLAFWMDWANYEFISGIGYRGAVAVEYTLQDSSGKTLWKGLAAVEQTYRRDSAEKLFGPALPRLAARAAKAFGSEEFVKAVP